MSSIAASSSPLTVMPALRKRALGMRTGSAPMPLIPSAVASRLAGSTVRTRTRLSSAAAIARPSAALTVVLPTPPLPQQITTSSDASWRPSPAGSLRTLRRRSGTGATSVCASCQPGAERVGDGASRCEPGSIDDERDRDNRHGELAPELAHVARRGFVEVRLEVEAGLDRRRRATQVLGSRRPRAPDR